MKENIMLAEILSIRRAHAVNSDPILDEMIAQFYGCYSVYRYAIDAKGNGIYETCVKNLPKVYRRILRHVKVSKIKTCIGDALARFFELIISK